MRAEGCRCIVGATGTGEPCSHLLFRLSFSGLIFLELIDLRDRGDLRAVAVKIPLGRDVACVGPAHRHDMRSGVKLPDMLKASASTVASVLSDPADVLRRRSSR